MDTRFDAEIEELGLNALERRVQELTRLCDQLRQENHSLRAQQSMLLAERAELIDKNEIARSRVESIILRLKEMEQQAQ